MGVLTRSPLQRVNPSSTKPGSKPLLVAQGPKIHDFATEPDSQLAGQPAAKLSSPEISQPQVKDLVDAVAASLAKSVPTAKKPGLAKTNVAVQSAPTSIQTATEGMAQVVPASAIDEPNQENVVTVPTTVPEESGGNLPKTGSTQSSRMDASELRSLAASSLESNPISPPTII